MIRTVPNDWLAQIALFYQLAAPMGIAYQFVDTDAQPSTGGVGG